MKSHDKLFFYIIGFVVILAFFIEMAIVLMGCGPSQHSCDPIDGTYTVSYMPEQTTESCNTLSKDAQFVQAFSDGQPQDSGGGCDASAEVLNDSQCDIRITWECSGTTDSGFPFSASFVDVVSKHDGGAALEGNRAVHLVSGGQWCEGSGSVRYEARE